MLMNNNGYETEMKNFITSYDQGNCKIVFSLFHYISLKLFK